MAPTETVLAKAADNKLVGSLCKRHAVTPCGAPTSSYASHFRSISSPFRGAFHLSLTVLSAIDLCTFLALDGGPPGFRPDFTCPTLLRIPPPSSTHFVYGALTLYGRPFQGRSPMREESDMEVLQPHVQVRGLGCSPFARHYSGNLGLDFFSPVTEMFQFTEYASLKKIQGPGI